MGLFGSPNILGQLDHTEVITCLQELRHGKNTQQTCIHDKIEESHLFPQPQEEKHNTETYPQSPSIWNANTWVRYRCSKSTRQKKSRFHTLSTQSQVRSKQNRYSPSPRDTHASQVDTASGSLTRLQGTVKHPTPPSATITGICSQASPWHCTCEQVHGGVRRWVHTHTHRHLHALQMDTAPGSLTRLQGIVKFPPLLAPHPPSISHCADMALWQLRGTALCV